MTKRMLTLRNQMMRTKMMMLLMFNLRRKISRLKELELVPRFTVNGTRKEISNPKLSLRAMRPRLN